MRVNHQFNSSISPFLSEMTNRTITVVGVRSYILPNTFKFYYKCFMVVKEGCRKMKTYRKIGLL